MNKREFTTIFFYYAIITLLTTFPIVFNLTLPIGPPEDNQMFIWNIWWFKHAIFHLGTSPFNTHYLFYPQGASLFFHTFSPLNNLISLVIEPIFGLIITYNLLLLIPSIMGAIGTYYLLKYFKISNAAAFIGGIIYSFNPFHLAHLSHHLNISSIYLVPFLILCSLKYIENNKPKYLVLSAILLAANFYYDPYIFLFSTILISLLPFSVDTQAAGHRFRNYIGIVSIFAISMVLISPLLIPMILEVTGGNFVTLPGHDSCVIDLAGFFFPDRCHWTRLSLLNNLVNLSYKANFWESAAFMGYLVLPMAIWSIFNTQFRLKKYIILVGLLGAILSLGSSPQIFGRSFSFIKLPIYFMENIPGLNAARSPSRFIFLTYFSLSILAAQAADYYFSYLRANYSRWINAAAVVVLSLCILADYWSIPFESSNIPIPGFFQQIGNENGEYAILNLPQTGWSENERYMYYQTIHQKPICNGQLARSDQKYFLDWQKIPITSESLGNRNIKYIALYSEFMEHQDYIKLKQQYSRNFSCVAEEDGISLYKIY